MRIRTFAAIGASAALAMGATACGGDDNKDSGSSSGGGDESAKLSGAINGAGATFPEPVYQEWAAGIKEQGLTVNYQGIGSGGGVSKFTEGTVDFGASDSAMDEDELKAAKKKGEPVHIPTVFGGVTVAYKVADVDKGLKLDGKTAADIFLGKIKTWDDKKIAALNEGVKLPSSKITVCHRSDESGTTKLFLTYLAAYSKEWEKGPGVDKSVDWPTGTGANGNDGVANCVKQSEGSIGYVEEAYALQNDFTTAAMKNKDGQFVEPTLESTSAAGEGVKVPDDLRFDSIDAPGAETYPIASATFVLVYKDMCKAGRKEANAKNTKAWLDYALGEGQDKASDLSYSPLPDELKTKAQEKVDGLTCNGSPIS